MSLYTHAYDSGRRRRLRLNVYIYMCTRAYVYTCYYMNLEVFFLRALLYGWSLWIERNEKKLLYIYTAHEYGAVTKRVFCFILWITSNTRRWNTLYRDAHIRLVYFYFFFMTPLIAQDSQKIYVYTTRCVTLGHTWSPRTYINTGWP